jgi:hypothetical protein
MRVWLGLALVIPTVGSPSAADAQPLIAPDPAIFQLGAAFVEQSLDVANDLCSQRVPASSAAWQQASRQWREDHREKLDALRNDVIALEAKLRSRPAQRGSFDLAQYAMFSAQGSALIMYGLAGASDSKVVDLCEKLRANMLDRATQDILLDQAHAAIDAALREVSRN